MPEAVKETSEVNAQVNEEPEKVEKPDVACSGTLPAEENVPMDAEAEKAPPTDAEKPEEGNTDEKPNAEKIQEIVNKGRELIAHHDYVAAADLFGKACEYAATLYGDMAEECAENYFLYGTAMLECGKAENTVLGEKVQDKDEEDDEEIEDEEDKENQENGENGEKPEDEENDDSSLKAAWEMLELAKIIFEKKGDKVRLSDCYLKLGEVGVESGHPTAMDDMIKCLEIRKELYPGERILSETYFNIGLAYSTFQLFNDAVENFELSKSVLESRLATMKTKDDKKSQDEIKEIEELLPELDEKILDMKESKKALLEEIAKNGVAKAGEGSSSEKTPENVEEKASDISHLVKRKRKIDEVTQDLNEKKKMICKESDKTETVVEKKVETVEKMDTISKEEKTVEESQPAEKNGKTETSE